MEFKEEIDDILSNKVTGNINYKKEKFINDLLEMDFNKDNMVEVLDTILSHTSPTSNQNSLFLKKTILRNLTAISNNEKTYMRTLKVIDKQLKSYPDKYKNIIEQLYNIENVQTLIKMVMNISSLDKDAKIIHMLVSIEELIDSIDITNYKSLPLKFLSVKHIANTIKTSYDKYYDHYDNPNPLSMVIIESYLKLDKDSELIQKIINSYKEDAIAIYIMRTISVRDTQTTISQLVAFQELFTTDAYHNFIYNVVESNIREFPSLPTGYYIKYSNMDTLTKFDKDKFSSQLKDTDKYKNKSLFDIMTNYDPYIFRKVFTTVNDYFSRKIPNIGINKEESLFYMIHRDNNMYIRMLNTALAKVQ